MVQLRSQNQTVLGSTPLDKPYSARPHRLYFAVTNYCNRACPWCCTYSSPRGKSWLDIQTFLSRLPGDFPYEVQFEGGEPTTHPNFFELVRLARGNKLCRKVIVVTNGVNLPRERASLADYLRQLGTPLTVKLSINHYLLSHDRGLLDLAALLKLLAAGHPGFELVLNVRLRKGALRDDGDVLDAITSADLSDVSNVFFLQRYGLATEASTWEEPFVVGTNFTLFTPDGRNFGTDLITRSEAMREVDERSAL